MKSLLTVSEDAFANSLKRIEKFGYYLPTYSIKLKDAKNLVIDQNYKNQDLRHSSFTDCQVTGANFQNAVLADSKCTDTVFKNIRLHHTNVEYCNFTSCKFIDEKRSMPFIGTNFSFSNFVDCELVGIEIANSTLDSVTFYNTAFRDSRFFMSTVENSKFQKCFFENVELCDLNLCFSDFEEIQMKHVSFPFYQLPYVFGGLQYFLHTDEDVFIGSESSDEKILYPNQYKQLLPDIINYFKFYNEFFPIANIYMACDESSLAYETIILGIKQSAKQKDFRMLKFLCKLAADTHMFSPKQLQALYDQIYDAASSGNLTDFERKNYFINLGVIRELLLFNDNQKSTLEYCIKTNIDNTDSKRLAILLSEIENIFTIFQDEDITYRIELKHQCPWDIIYKIIASTPQLECLIHAFAAMLGQANTVVSFINNCINLAKLIFNSTSQNKSLKEDKEIKERQLNVLKQQEDINEQQKVINQQQIYINNLKIEQLKNSLIYSNRIICESGISVTTSYHIK